MDKLSEFYVKKLRTELNETETRKEQSIKQFYEWLSKHPFVKKCKIEQFQVIHLCRARKYNMTGVYDNFHTFIILKQNFPELVDFQNSQKLLEIYDKGPFLVMKNRDSNGCRILNVRVKVLEDINVCFSDLSRLNHLVGASIMDETETQICGLVFIIDLRDVTMNFTKTLEMKYLKLLKLSDSCNARIKQIIVLGLPAFASAIFELINSFISEKMRSRLKLCKNVEELAKFVDVKILTAEYGGSENLQDTLMHQRDKVKAEVDIAIKFFSSIEIDEKAFKVFENEKNFEGVGSFRKLEID